MSDKTTFKELVNTISDKTGSSRRSTVDFIHNFAELIESSLREDGSATLAGFGKIELRRMKARKGVNPETGADIHVPAQNKVVFKPFKSLREQVNAPYEHLEARLLKEETGEEDNLTGSTSVKTTGSRAHIQAPVEKQAPVDNQIPSDNEESVDDLVYERPSPIAKK